MRGELTEVESSSALPLSGAIDADGRGGANAEERSPTPQRTLNHQQQLTHLTVAALPQPPILTPLPRSSCTVRRWAVWDEWPQRTTEPGTVREDSEEAEWESAKLQ